MLIYSLFYSREKGFYLAQLQLGGKNPFKLTIVTIKVNTEVARIHFCEKQICFWDIDNSQW